jgi:hypothetical protein
MDVEVVYDGDSLSDYQWAVINALRAKMKHTEENTEGGLDDWGWIGVDI